MNNNGMIGMTVELKSGERAIIFDKILVGDNDTTYIGPSYSLKEKLIFYSVTKYLVKLFKKVPKIKRNDSGSLYEDEHDCAEKIIIEMIYPSAIKKIIN